MPANAMCVSIGWIISTPIQPIPTYSTVESRGYLKPTTSLDAMPPSASVQMVAASAHPHGPRSAPRVNGVYVPAISR